eukprot:1157243-Pelagomonas_calceolata.AAC.6
MTVWNDQKSAQQSVSQFIAFTNHHCCQQPNAGLSSLPPSLSLSHTHTTDTRFRRSAERCGTPASPSHSHTSRARLSGTIWLARSRAWARLPFYAQHPSKAQPMACHPTFCRSRDFACSNLIRNAFG